MLLSKTAIVTWNSKNKRHYVDLGYHYTKMGDNFEVQVQDLTVGSMAMVTVVCDYCGNSYQIRWNTYMQISKKTCLKKDCCCNCLEDKVQETIKAKYGTKSVLSLPEVREKIKNTCVERYGVDNPFAADEVKEKIKTHYMDNYGVTHNMQIPEVQAKSKETCMERYGVENYALSSEFRESMTGENSPVWKGGSLAREGQNQRYGAEGVQWRKAVYQRDDYTCQKCHQRSTFLNAHHICNYADYPEMRFDIDNGITLCKECHHLFHQTYGNRHNTRKQLEEFLNS